MDIDLSADGRWVVVASGSGVYIHDIQDLSAEPRAIEVVEGVTAVSISPTGDKVAIITWGKEFQFWQVEPLTRLFTSNEVVQVQFSPDGSALAITKEIIRDNMRKRSVEIWDSDDGAVIVSYRAKYRFNPMIKFSPNGSRVAVWSQYDDVVDVYDWEDDRLEYTNQAILHRESGEEYHQAMIQDLTFLTEVDLRFLIVEILDSTFVTGRIEVQEADNNALLFSAEHIGYLSGPIEKACNDPYHSADPPEPTTPFQMEVSSDSQIVALRYEDSDWGDHLEYSSLRFHNVGGGQLYVVEEGVVDFEFSSDGQTWVAGLQDGRLQVRRLSNGAVLDSVDAYESPILDTIISADGLWVGVVHVDEVKIYHREDGNLQHRYPATKITFAPDGESFVLAYHDGRLELRDIKGGELINAIAGHQDRVTAISYLPSGELLSAGADCDLTIWEMPAMLRMGSLENILINSAESPDSEEKVSVHIRDFLVMPDGQSVIGLFFDFGIWSMDNGTLLREPGTDYQKYTRILAVSSDGRTLAVSSHRIPESWDSSITFVETEAAIVDFSPDTSLFAGGKLTYYDQSGMLEFWEVSPMNLLHTLTPQTGAITTSIVFTQDGQLIFTSALDGIVRIWGIP